MFFCKAAHMNEIYVNDFYRDSKLDPREQISRETFLEVFPKVKHVKFLAFVATLIDGYKRELLNFEDDSATRELLG